MLTHQPTSGGSKPYASIVALRSLTDPRKVSQDKANQLIRRIIVAAIALTLLTLLLLQIIHLQAGQSTYIVVTLLIGAIPESLLVALPILVLFYIHKLRTYGIPVNGTQAIADAGAIDTIIITDKDALLEKPRVESLWHFDKNTDTTIASLSKTLSRTSKQPSTALDEAIGSYMSAQGLPLPSQKPVKELSFDPTFEMSGALWHHGSQFEVYVKGSAEAILALCDISENEREHIEATLHSFSSKGYSLVATAHTKLSHAISTTEELQKIRKFDFDGLVLLEQRVRPQVKSSISLALANSINVKLVSGGHFESAYALGKELGLVSKKQDVIDNKHLHHLTTQQKKHSLQSATIISNVSFDHITSVLAMLTHGSVVAPAPNSFRRVVHAIVTSRQLFANIRQILIYLLTISSIEVLMLFEAAVGGITVPFFASQILWSNLVINAVIILIIGTRKATGTTPPAQFTSSSRTSLIFKLLITIIATVGLLLGIYAIFDTLDNRSYAQTMTLTTLISLQWLIAYYMTATSSDSSNHTVKMPFIIGFVGTVAFQVLLLATPLCSEALHTTPVALPQLFVALVISLCTLVILLESHKYFHRLRRK